MQNPLLGYTPLLVGTCSSCFAGTLAGERGSFSTVDRGRKPLTINDETCFLLIDMVTYRVLRNVLKVIINYSSCTTVVMFSHEPSHFPLFATDTLDLGDT